MYASLYLSRICNDPRIFRNLDLSISCIILESLRDSVLYLFIKSSMTGSFL